MLIKKAIDRGSTREAQDKWLALLHYIQRHTGGVDIYDVRRFKEQITRLIPGIHNSRTSNLLSIYEVDLWPLMNGAIRRQLRIIPDRVSWGGRYVTLF